jgi:transcriptional regulator CtsR
LHLLAVDALTLAADGDYRAAINRCLTIHRLAEHIPTDEMLLFSLTVDRTALFCIQRVLGSMPPDVEILTWLRGQLAAVSSTSQSLALALKMDYEFMSIEMRKDPNTIARLIAHLAKNTSDKSAKKEILILTDDEVITRAQQSYAKYLDSVLRAIGSDMSYEKTYAEIKRLTDKLDEQANSDPVIILLLCAEQVVRWYDLQVAHKARFNALKAAIEIYLETAKAGQLPDTIPNYLPKDPYSDKDFEYEMTKKGFLLRCRIKPIEEREVWQYEFKVDK